MTTFGESAPAESCLKSSASPLTTLLRKQKRCVIGKMLCEKGRESGPSDCWQVRVVYAGCGVNALSVLQDFQIQILQEVCRPDKRSASGSLSLLSVSRAAKAALFLLSRDNGTVLPGIMVSGSLPSQRSAW